jgi:cell division protein FtsI (penicillin-binding protein 3)
LKRSRARAVAGKLPVWRLRLLLALFGCAFLVLLGRAVYLQGYNDRFLQAKGESRYSRVIEIPANRGRILDRNGEALAVSTPVRSVWAIPDEVNADARQLADLARLLESNPRELRRKLGDGERDFMYLKRQLPPEVADRVAGLGIRGVSQSREYRRYYPGGEVMAHVLGFTGVDDTGQEGVELAFQEVLAGRPGSRRVIKDRRGEIVEDVESIRAAQPGRDVVLSIDSRVQHLAFQHLRQAVAAHRAKGGGIVVIDVTTGELLALANLPAYNPNNRTGMQGAQLRNRVVTDAFEPGSTLKPFTIALALDTGKVKPETVIQTAPGTLTIGSATIRDAHAAGALTVTQVIQKSSNVGSAKIALGLKPDQMWNLFSDVGFGAQPRLGFPGESPGRVRPVKTWKPVEQATMSYGHGISVSLVQLARAYTMFARDGELVPLSLTRLDGPPPAKRVLGASTAREVRRMLEMAAGPGGTAPRAQVMGYRVAGKTGTAHKLVDGAYSPNRYLSSFVGFAPVSSPRLVVAVMIDEPGAGDYYGGLVAAPVFSAVMGGALRVLGVTPDAPMKPIELPAAGSEVEESL